MKLNVICIIMVFIMPFLVLHALPKWIALSTFGDILFYGLIAAGIMLCDGLKAK